MRRGLASLLLGLSLVVASFSWAGFTLSRTILDPGVSERLADQLLDDESVRSALTTRMADSLEEQLPDEVPVPREIVEGAAQTAIDDPRVESVIRDGFVQAHQNALNGEDEPITIETSAIGEAGRDALVGVDPVLETFLPSAPSIGVELPTTGLAWIGSVKDFVDRYTILGAFVAAIGALIALLIAKKRAVVFRRVAYWAFGAAAFWLIIGYGVPWLLSLVSPTSSAFASALVRIFFNEMIRPAITMAIFGVIMLVTSLIWPIFARRRGANKLQPRQSVIADLRTDPNEAPLSPPLKPAAASSQPDAAPILAETKAGWMSKDQTPSQSQAVEGLSHVRVPKSGGRSASNRSATAMPLDEPASTRQRENTAVMSTEGAAHGRSESFDEPIVVEESSISVTMPATDSESKRDSQPELAIDTPSDASPAVAADPVENSEPNPASSGPRWVEGRGYSDDDRVSPFIKPSEEIDLKDIL